MCILDRLRLSDAIRLSTGVAVALATAGAVVLTGPASPAAAAGCEATLPAGGTLPQLQAMVDAVTGDADDELCLAGDVTGAAGESLTIPEDVPITIDTNGYTLRIVDAPVDSNPINVSGSATLTLRSTGGGGFVILAHGVASGIGGGIGDTTGTIVIDGAKVDTTGGSSAAGIGGSNGGAGGTVTITGIAVVTAIGGTSGADPLSGGAGIGGGYLGAGGSTTITSGTVTSTGADGGAGIGGGGSGAGGATTIGNGMVTATGGTAAAGIGGGVGGAGGDVELSGGIVTAVGGGVVEGVSGSGAGIGGGGGLAGGSGGSAGMLHVVGTGLPQTTGTGYSVLVDGGGVGFPTFQSSGGLPCFEVIDFNDGIETDPVARTTFTFNELCLLVPDGDLGGPPQQAAEAMQAPGADEAAQTLPATGFDSNAAALVGAYALLLFGAGIVMVTVRRRTD